MIPYKCNPIFALPFPPSDFYIGGRLLVTSKKKEMNHRFPTQGGIRAREISAEGLSFVEVAGLT